MASDSDGNVVALGYDSGLGAIILRKYGDAGNEIWTRTFPQSPIGTGRVAVGANGAIYATTAVPFTADLGGGPQSGPLLARFSAGGQFERYLTACSGGCILGAMAIAPDGAIAVQRGVIDRPYIGDVAVLAPDGSERFRLERGGPAGRAPAPKGDNVDFGPFAFDPSGNLVVAATLRGRMSVAGREMGSAGTKELVVLKLDSSGAIVWARELVGSVFPTALGISAIGTVVLAGVPEAGVVWSGTGTFPKGQGGFLLTLEADGSPRWVREEAMPAYVLAVDPAGRVAVSGLSPRESPVGYCQWLWLAYYDLAGERRWRREIGFQPRACQSILDAPVLTTLPNHDVVLADALRGTFDLGTGPVTAKGDSDAVLLDIAP